MDTSIDREEFAQLNEEGVTVPVRYSLDQDISPPEAYDILRRFDDTGYSFLLESAETADIDASSEMQDHGRYSFIGFNPSAVVRTGEGEASIESLRQEKHDLSFDQTVEGSSIVSEYDPLDVLRDVSPQASIEDSCDESRPFEGGLVGFHPYDMVYDTKPVDVDREDVPQSVFVFADRFLAYDHVEDEMELVFTSSASESSAEEYDRIEEDAGEVIDALLTEEADIPAEISILDRRSGDREEYEGMVEEVGEHVEKGDIYQGVVSRSKEFEATGDPLTVYEDLRERNPSPYMYFLDFADRTVLGASPETLVKTRDGKVETNPIAGTVGRGQSPIDDRRKAGEMLANDKEVAEHAMLVDLGRNDIKRVSEPGTTEVDELMQVVPYSTVQHLESIVTGELEEGKDRFDAMRSVFPAGTLSGAPKVRAMEIIDEQEDEPRNLYGGAVGYYSQTGAMDSAITIRTMTAEDTEKGFNATVQAGAGIVADSEPGKEFEETEKKMGSIVESLEAVNGGDKEGVKNTWTCL
ncbi:MAG: anthranilate synthase component I family protein [Candidatus Nanohalobium sp.]